MPLACLPRRPAPASPQVCGILLVMCGGGHMVLWWGLACFPATRAAFIAAYVACGAASVWAALRARSARARALPMLGLLLVRLGVYAARAVLERGTARLPGQPLQHYLLLELFTLAGGLVNVARVPERWLQPADPAHPAPLDLWLNSHQVRPAWCLAAPLLRPGMCSHHAVPAVVLPPPLLLQVR